MVSVKFDREEIEKLVGKISGRSTVEVKPR